MKKVAIIGAHGYGGRELARLCLGHPYLRLAAVFTRKADWHLSHELTESAAVAVPHYDSEDLLDVCADFDIFFLATPADVSMSIAKALWDRGKIIIDLSGAFRLSKDEFESWYGMGHHASELIEHAIYGLSPWTKLPDLVGGPILIANPGCFANCALMSLLPLIKHGLIDNEGIIIDAKSGASGAGRTVQSALQFCELSESFYPYKIAKHQHTPEIEQCLMQQCQPEARVKLHLTTSLLPIKRGISMAIYCPLKQATRQASLTLQAIEDSYQTDYADYSLARYSSLQQAESTPACKTLLSLKSVIATARVHIVFHVDNGRCLIFASIDNLMKGAASTAIENVNRLFKLPVDTGLSSWEGIL